MYPGGLEEGKTYATALRDKWCAAGERPVSWPGSAAAFPFMRAVGVSGNEQRALTPAGAAFRAVGARVGASGSRGGARGAVLAVGAGVVKRAPGAVFDVGSEE